MFVLFLCLFTHLACLCCLVDLCLFLVFLIFQFSQLISFSFLQNIDLHALTGWIPERIAIRLDNPEFNKDKTFARIKERFHRGDVLVTVATGAIPQQEADRAGLVTTHAYAMLDVREFKVSRVMLENVIFLKYL